MYIGKVHGDGPDKLVVEEGGVIEVADEHGLKIGGTEVTADQIGATYLADVTPGTAAASKAVVLDANGKVDTLDVTSLKLGGTAVTVTAAKLNEVPAHTLGTTAASKLLAAGSYTAVEDDDTAGNKVIATGLTTISVALVQVLRDGKVVASDVAVAWANGNLTVGDGTTFALTTGDVVNWVAFGV